MIGNNRFSQGNQNRPLSGPPYPPGSPYPAQQHPSVLGSLYNYGQGIWRNDIVHPLEQYVVHPLENTYGQVRRDFRHTGQVAAQDYARVKRLANQQYRHVRNTFSNDYHQGRRIIGNEVAGAHRRLNQGIAAGERFVRQAPGYVNKHLLRPVEHSLNNGKRMAGQYIQNVHDISETTWEPIQEGLSTYSPQDLAKMRASATAAQARLDRQMARPDSFSTWLENVPINEHRIASAPVSAIYNFFASPIEQAGQALDDPDADAKEQIMDQDHRGHAVGHGFWYPTPTPDEQQRIAALATQMHIARRNNIFLHPGNAMQAFYTQGFGGAQPDYVAGLKQDYHTATSSPFGKLGVVALPLIAGYHQLSQTLGEGDASDPYGRAVDKYLKHGIEHPDQVGLEIGGLVDAGMAAPGLIRDTAALARSVPMAVGNVTKGIRAVKGAIPLAEITRAGLTGLKDFRNVPGRAINAAMGKDVKLTSRDNDWGATPRAAERAISPGKGGLDQYYAIHRGGKPALDENFKEYHVEGDNPVSRYLDRTVGEKIRWAQRVGAVAKQTANNVGLYRAMEGITRDVLAKEAAKYWPKNPVRQLRYVEKYLDDRMRKYTDPENTHPDAVAVRAKAKSIAYPRGVEIPETSPWNYTPAGFYKAVREFNKEKAANGGKVTQEMLNRRNAKLLKAGIGTAAGGVLMNGYVRHLVEEEEKKKGWQGAIARGIANTDPVKGAKIVGNVGHDLLAPGTFQQRISHAGEDITRAYADEHPFAKWLLKELGGLPMKEGQYGINTKAPVPRAVNATVRAYQRSHPHRQISGRREVYIGSPMANLDRMMPAERERARKNFNRLGTGAIGSYGG